VGLLSPRQLNASKKQKKKNRQNTTTEPGPRDSYNDPIEPKQGETGVCQLLRKRKKTSTHTVIRTLDGQEMEGPGIPSTLTTPNHPTKRQKDRRGVVSNSCVRAKPPDHSPQRDVPDTNFDHNRRARAPIPPAVQRRGPLLRTKQRENTTRNTTLDTHQHTTVTEKGARHEIPVRNAKEDATRETPTRHIGMWGGCRGGAEAPDEDNRGAWVSGRARRRGRGGGITTTHHNEGEESVRSNCRDEGPGE